MSRKPKIHFPSAEEDAAITAAALADPDALPLSDAELAQFKPAQARGRPALPPELKRVPINVRLDPRVLNAFKATGAGWQSRMNDALREWAEEHHLIPKA